MRKVTLLLVGLCSMCLPSTAMVNFYRGANGNIMAEVENCRGESRMLVLTGIPDDPPDGAPTDPDAGADIDPTAAQGAVPSEGEQILKASGEVLRTLIAPDDEEAPEEASAYGTSEEGDDESSFDARQDAFMAYVRDVNWKTDLQITHRDMGFFRRLKMLCMSDDQLDNKIADAGIDELEQAIRAANFHELAKLSIAGLTHAIEVENPFLLLLLDEETYGEVLAQEPKIAQLYEDMYTFFKIRAVHMKSYRQNTKALVRIAKLGKGDTLETWHIMAEYSKKMLGLLRKGKLQPYDEKTVHVYRLEMKMRGAVKERVRVEKAAARMLAKDPQNAALVQEIKASIKRGNTTIKKEAEKLLKNCNRKDVERLIKKYVVK